MDVRVIKGMRTDKVEARRADGSVVRFDLVKKGPVPHDLVHLLVEEELGIDRGFWGLIASGLQPSDIERVAKAGGHASVSRARLPDPEIVPILQAERIVEAFEADLWGGGHDNDSVRAMAASGCEQSHVRPLQLSDARVDRIRSRLRHLRNEWEALPIGAAIEFGWAEQHECALQ